MENATVWPVAIMFGFGVIACPLESVLCCLFLAYRLSQ
jgi:hypothetical protein